MKRELTQCQLIERSIQKKYRKELWRPFTEAIKKYELIKEGDKIAVCISGGKDSMLMAKMFQLLHRITDFPKYELIKEGDKIAVCISGGKDSMLMAKMFQLLHRITDFPFELVYMVMDPGYNEVNRQKIIDNAALLEIPIEIFNTDIFNAANSVDKSPCYLCARMA